MCVDVHVLLMLISEPDKQPHCIYTCLLGKNKQAVMGGMAIFLAPVLGVLVEKYLLLQVIKIY